MKGICLIPARGGSKRVPRKNIRNFNGSSLLDLTLRCVLDSGCFDKIILSSEDEEILTAGGRYPEIEFHRRSEKLSSDTATVFEVFNQLLIENPGFDFVSGVLVTSPFKTSKQLQEAVALYRSTDSTANVISVCKYDFPPQYAFRMDEKSTELTMLFPEIYEQHTLNKRDTESMRPMRHPNGVIWVGSVKNYLQNKTFYKGKLIGYEMDALSSFDIDHPHQFELAEMYAKKISVK